MQNDLLFHYSLNTLIQWLAIAPISNLICDIKDNGISVLKKISDSPLINNWIIEKLDIKKYSLNQFVINNYTAITEDLMTAYKLEFKTNINDNYKNPGNKSLKPIIYNNSNDQFMNKFNKGQNFNNNMNQINQHKLFNQPNQFNQFNQVNQNFWHNNQIILMNNQRQLNNMQINLQNLQMQNILEKLLIQQIGVKIALYLSQQLVIQ